MPPSFEVVLVCLSIVCIDGITGSLLSSIHEHEDDNGPLERHALYKRQDNLDKCDEIRGEAFCTTGIYEEYAEIAQFCNSVNFSLAIQNGCQQNSMGAPCFLVEVDPTIEDVCGSMSSTTTCTPECRSLLTDTRNQMGCCIPSYANNSMIFESDRRTMFSYSLWSGCGVEPVLRECTDYAFYLPHITPAHCNVTIAEQKVYSALCRRHYTEAVQDILASKGCKFQKYEDDDAFFDCSVSESGEYCAAQSSLTPLFEAADSSCHNTTTCTPTCRHSLQNISSAGRGCCFNDRFNISCKSCYDWMSYEFWSKCGLHPLGVCGSRINDDVPFRYQTNIKYNTGWYFIATTNDSPIPTLSFIITILALFLSFVQNVHIN